MSNKRYIEIDSTYRNREQYPDPSQFTVLISQSGTRDKFHAYDPVSDSAPIKEWTAGDIDDFIVENPLPIVYPYSANKFKVCVKTQMSAIPASTTPPNRVIDYYRGVGITISGENTSVISSEYVNTIGGKDCFWLTVLPALITAPTGGEPVAIGNIFDVTNGHFWVPCSFGVNNAYTDYYLWNDTLQKSTKILSYDGSTHTVGVDPSEVAGWVDTENLVIRKVLPQSFGELPSQTLPVPVPVLSSNQVVVGQASSDIYDYYTGGFIRFTSDSNKSIMCRITNYTGNNTLKPGTTTAVNKYTITFNCAQGTVLSGFNENDKYEILQFTRDNVVPFTYTGSLVSQQEMVCYEIELINLVLPNRTLASGGLIAFYPYVYVELQNVSGVNSGNRGIIYSNNPNAGRMLFRAAIDDMPNPVLSPFIKIDGDGMVQTVKFKPNDNLKFGVYLPNGDPFETERVDTHGPKTPDPILQISAVFSIRRL